MRRSAEKNCTVETSTLYIDEDGRYTMKYCMKCGAPMKEADNFCSNCGMKVGKDKAVSDGMHSDPFFFQNVEQVLSSCPAVFQLFKGFSVKTRDDSITTVDYMALTNHGVFIFNLVNVAGVIREIAKSDYWECSGSKIDNPLSKSETDLYSVKSFFLKRKFTNLFSYIVFPDGADLTGVNTGGATRIITVSGLRKAFEEDIRHYGIIYSEGELVQLSKMISPDAHSKDHSELIHNSSSFQGPRWATGKHIFGIVSLVSTAILLYGVFSLGTEISMTEVSVIAGCRVILAICFLVTGIIAIAARNSAKRFPWIVCSLLLFFGCFCAASQIKLGNDLLIWGLVSYLFGAFYLLSTARKPAGIIVSLAVIILWGVFYFLAVA